MTTATPTPETPPASPRAPSHLRAFGQDAFELLGSMRFAISLLVVICLASVAGTILPQNRPLADDIDQFGPFWAGLLRMLSLDRVYNAGWFLLIMGFLVISTAVCVLRHAPGFLREAWSFRDHIGVRSWRAFPERAQASAPVAPAAAAERVALWLQRRGFRTRLKPQGDGLLVAARAGASNRLGYIAAHLAIVIICLGGLVDSELPVRWQIAFGGKVPVHENLRLVDVPETGRLPPDLLGFRASALVPEGGSTQHGVVVADGGALVQPLPFTLTLDRFTIDYYDTGMPSDFRSDVTVTDPDTGERFSTVIRVNEPLVHRGVAVYQSSFDDGGSGVTLRAVPLDGSRQAPVVVRATVGDTLDVPWGDAGWRLGVVALRPINVENLADVGAATPQAFGEHVAAVAGSAARPNTTLRNVGPSIEYRLVDRAGQATDFHNYMLPLLLDGSVVFLLGTRTSPAEPYRYLRIPADAEFGLDEFLALRAALADPQARVQAARRFAERGQGGAVPLSPAAQQALRAASERALGVFATDGLLGITQMLEQQVAPDELPQAADMMVRLLGGAMAELRTVARAEAGLPVLATDADTRAREETWLRLAMGALSDLSLYPAPLAFTLTEFSQVQASVFQINRAPGQWVVYLGCLLLMVGIFAMFYVRERRIWVWVRPGADGGSELLLAMTARRRHADYRREARQRCDELGRLFPPQEKA